MVDLPSDIPLAVQQNLSERASNLTCKYYLVNLKTPYYGTPYIKFEGNCNRLDDILFVKWRCEEIRSFDEFSNMIVIDWRSLVISAERLHCFTGLLREKHLSTNLNDAFNELLQMLH